MSQVVVFFFFSFVFVNLSAYFPLGLADIRKHAGQRQSLSCGGGEEMVQW